MPGFEILTNKALDIVHDILSVAVVRSGFEPVLIDWLADAEDEGQRRAEGESWLAKNGYTQCKCGIAYNPEYSVGSSMCDTCYFEDGA